MVDKGLRIAVETNLPPIKTLPCYDVVIIDEAQDMTKLLFAFSMKILRDVFEANNRLIHLSISRYFPW